jgi:peptidoglycan-associated lipoprotein
MMRSFVTLIVIFVTLPIVFSCVKTRHVTVAKKSKGGKAITLPYPRVHFPFDMDEIVSSEIPNLDENAEWMKSHRQAVIILEGHCDEIGESHYNMELGDRRARNIKAHLIDRGIDHERIIMVVIFGDTQPLDLSHTRSAWKKNRRVEFILR